MWLSLGLRILVGYIPRFRVSNVHGFWVMIGPLKDPGIDGFSVYFYRHYWHIISKGVSEAILGFLNDESDISRLNSTRIIFIPKNNNLENMSHYHPISLVMSCINLLLRCLLTVLKRFFQILYL